MRTDLLLEHFHTLVKMQEDVAGLEAAILDLAMQGQLAPVCPDDKPAEELLQQIAEERKKLVREGKTRRLEPLPSVEPDKIPFRLPKRWIWCRLGQVILDIRGGKTPSKRNPEYWNGSVPWASVKDLNQGMFLTDTVDKITKKAIEETRIRVVPKGNVIVCTRMGLGKIALNEVDVAINQDLKAITLPAQIDRRFFYYLYRTLVITGSGMTVHGIKQDELLKMPIALPPLAEQSRIVVRIEELLAQTRTLASQLEAADEALIPAAKASFQSLTDTPDRAAQSEAWQRVSDAFDDLTADPRTLHALKQTMLQLAVQGKLAPQDPDDEPASVQLERIEAEKRRLAEAGEIRRTTKSKRISDEEKPHPLPSGWTWGRLSEIALSIQTGPFGSNLHKSDYVENGIPVVNPASMKDGRIVPIEGMSIDEKTRERLGTYALKAGDIIMARRGEMGRCALVTAEEDGWLCGTGSLVIRFTDDIYRGFIVRLFGSGHVRAYLRGSSVGMTMSNLNQGILKKLVIGVPPLAEQKRIVAKVESLLALCDSLVAEVVAAEEIRGRLLQAMLNGE